MRASPIALVGMVVIASCAKSNEAPMAGASAASASALVPAAGAPVAGMPDIGRIEHVRVSAEGIGATPDAAVQGALRLAVLEVNGESIDAGSIAVKFGLDVASDQTAESLRGSVFAEALETRSKGAIRSFKLVRLTEPAAAGQPYKASVEASIAKYIAPADSKKIKIVISPLHIPADRFDIGGTRVAASKIGEDVRQRLIDALSASGRFTVLDRDFGPEIQSELDLVASGQTPSDEMAKLSQALSADLLWVGTINDFGYHRKAQHLQMADRDLVTYSGGWSVSQRILNVSTRQIVLSNTLKNQLPATAPTTMDRGVDEAQLAATMETQVVDQTVSAILAETFPLVILSRDGANVILNQGGQAVRAGASYAIMALGKEMKDPQTGESLGRAETPCCDVVIDRVASKLAYGHLEHVKISLDSVDPIGLQVRGEHQAD